MAKRAPATGTTQDWARPAYQARSRDQRDRLLKAGERVFAEKGFWQAHVADIARGAGCSVGSFYRRFQDKEAFFYALQADMSERGEANIRRYFDDPARADEPLTTILRRLVNNTAKVIIGIEGYYRALMELSLRGANVWPLMRRLEVIEAGLILDLLRTRGVPLDGSAESRAHLGVRMMHSQLISSILHGPGPFEVGDPEFYEELALMLSRYLGLEGGALPN